METETLSQVPFELQGLAQAKRYQSWVGELVRPFMGTRILEIGAGIGNMSTQLPLGEKLVLSEGSTALIPLLKANAQEKFGASPKLHVQHVDIDQEWADNPLYSDLDTIVSFNVLEHIQDDQAAVNTLVGILKRSTAKKKTLVTFVPAHQFLFGEMDRTFGHYRRYDAKKLTTLMKTAAPSAKISHRYFNSVGTLGWFVSGRILKRKNIGASTIQAFEALCPYIKPVDNFCHKVLHLPMGQSLLVVAEIN